MRADGGEIFGGERKGWEDREFWENWENWENWEF